MLESKLAQSIITSFPGKRVLIVGDVMLDEYIYGIVQRISPEAPVPVVEIQQHTVVPGGAANAAMNIVALGGEAFLCGVVGNDAQADKLRNVILGKNKGLKFKFFIDDQRPTTTKTRIVAHNQQVLRIDDERPVPIRKTLENRIIRWVTSLIEKVDVCVLSDYDKGVLSPAVTQKVIQIARTAKKPIVVDPKSPNFVKYRFATVVTPNLKEAERATNITVNKRDNLADIGRQLQSILDGTAILITRGEKGMSLFFDDKFFNIPASARMVYDVTGAGDTVVSVLALALACGVQLRNAAILANIAAGIVVGKVGTATVTRSEILEQVIQYSVQGNG